jgi:hypothetical protein
MSRSRGLGAICILNYHLQYKCNDHIKLTGGGRVYVRDGFP